MENRIDALFDPMPLDSNLLEPTATLEEVDKPPCDAADGRRSDDTKDAGRWTSLCDVTDPRGSTVTDSPLGESMPALLSHCDGLPDSCFCTENRADGPGEGPPSGLSSAFSTSTPAMAFSRAMGSVCDCSICMISLKLLGGTELDGCSCKAERQAFDNDRCTGLFGDIAWPRILGDADLSSSPV